MKPVARALIARDALRADEFGGLSFGPAARPILKGEESVPLVLPPARVRGGGRSRRARIAEDHPHDPLFEALRACRRDIAKERGVPPYVVFHDSTLREMAAFRPRDHHALGQITGVGQSQARGLWRRLPPDHPRMEGRMSEFRAARRQDLRRRPDHGRRHRRGKGAGRHLDRQQPPGRRGIRPVDRLGRDRRGSRGGGHRLSHRAGRSFRLPAGAGGGDDGGAGGGGRSTVLALPLGHALDRALGAGRAWRRRRRGRADRPRAQRRL